METKFYSLGLVLAVGGLDPNNKKTELLETTTNTILKIISLYKDLVVWRLIACNGSWSYSENQTNFFLYKFTKPERSSIYSTGSYQDILINNWTHFTVQWNTYIRDKTYGKWLTGIVYLYTTPINHTVTHNLSSLLYSPGYSTVSKDWLKKISAVLLEAQW